MNHFKIYYAHPAFTDAQRQAKEELLVVFASLGSPTLILDPFEYSPNIEGDREQRKLLSKTVLEANHRLIRESDLIVAVIDDRDQGVIYEIGYAVALGIPVITVSSSGHDVNIMLSASVLAHFNNVVDDSNQFLSVVNSMIKLKTLKY